MKFKVDGNLPVEVAELPRQTGHDAATVLEQHLGGSPDSDLALVSARGTRLGDGVRHVCDLAQQKACRSASHRRFDGDHQLDANPGCSGVPGEECGTRQMQRASDVTPLICALTPSAACPPRDSIFRNSGRAVRCGRTHKPEVDKDMPKKARTAIIDCLNAGKPVLCEKPPAMNAQEAGELGDIYLGKAGYTRRRGIPRGKDNSFIDKKRSGGGVAEKRLIALCGLERTLRPREICACARCHGRRLKRSAPACAEH